MTVDQSLKQENRGDGAALLSLAGVQAVLFDLDGTLRHSRPSFNHVALDLAVQRGVPDSPERRRQALRWVHYYWAGSPELLEDLENSEADGDLLTRYVRRYLAAYGCKVERAAALAPEIYDQLSETHRSEDWVDPEAPRVLELLKERGLTLGVVSNRRDPFQELLEMLGLGAYFAFTLAAGEVDSWKPDQAIFQHAVRRAGSCPRCTVYVGDNYYADVVGARRAGLQPVLLDPERLFPEAGCPVICSLGELRPDK